MPAGDTLSVCGTPAPDLRLAKIPVVILSGMSDLGIQRDILRFGAKCWINKPLELKHPIKTIKHHIG